MSWLPILFIAAVLGCFPPFLICFWYSLRWNIAVLRWHGNLAREKGIVAAAARFYNPFRIRATIAAVRAENPHAYSEYRRALNWFLVYLGMLAVALLIGFIAYRVHPGSFRW